MTWACTGGSGAPLRFASTDDCPARLEFWTSYETLLPSASSVCNHYAGRYHRDARGSHPRAKVAAMCGLALSDARLRVQILTTGTRRRPSHGRIVTLLFVLQGLVGFRVDSLVWTRYGILWTIVSRLTFSSSRRFSLQSALQLLLACCSLRFDIYRRHVWLSHAAGCCRSWLFIAGLRW